MAYSGGVELVSAWVTFAEGRDTALVVRAAAAPPPLPAVVVLQHGWGVDHWIEDVAARIAMAGYVAIAPDLFSRDGMRPSALKADRVEAAKRFMDGLPPASWGPPAQHEATRSALPGQERIEVAETLATVFSGRADYNAYLQTLRSTLDWINASVLCAGRAIGALGFCMGGSLVGLLAAADARLRAGVIFYGWPPPAEHRLNIGCPLLGCYGAEDETGLTAHVPEFAASLLRLGVRFTHVVYPGAPHAFFNDTRISYRVDAARDSWARSLSFLAEHLPQAD